MVGISPTMLHRALAVGNRLHALVIAVSDRHGESFCADAAEAASGWQAVERKLRERLLAVRGSAPRFVKRRDMLESLRPGTTDSLFVPLERKDTVEQLRNRLKLGARYHGFRVQTRFETLDGVPGLRLWRVS